MSTILRGRTVTPTGIIDDGAVVIEGERLAYVGPAGPEHARADVHADYLLPGMVDIHCHGGGGASFPDALSEADVLTAVAEHRRHGTTTLVASTVTAAPETLRERTALLARVCDTGELDGIHWEGPFISCDRCGAQDPSLIITPDPALMRELLELAGPHAFTMTIAPEKEHITGDGGISDLLIQAGALPSFGHTDSNPASAEAAIADAAERLQQAVKPRSRRATATHLFNGMRPIHHRDPGPVPPLLAAAQGGSVVVELIADGVHLDPALVRSIYRLLGPGAIVFVTDAMAAAGKPDGRYRLGSMDVTVHNGEARLSDSGNLAGGSSHLLDQVRLMVSHGIELTDCVRMAATTPAEVLGRSDIGQLAPGLRADVVATDGQLHAQRVYRAGDVVA